MKVTRGYTFRLYHTKWCIKCGKITDMIPKNGLPAIFVQQCPECGIVYQANYWEEEADLIPIMDEAILPDDSILVKEEEHEEM